MVADYEEPTTCGSGYESMRSSTLTYKSTQIRPPFRPLPSRRLKMVRPRNAQNNYGLVLLVMIMITQLFTFATICYMLVVSEGKGQTPCKVDGSKIKLDTQQIENQMNQISASLNTVINAISYTLPQVLNSNKIAMSQRLNYMIHELREIVRLNAIDLDLRLGTNRSLSFRSGSNKNNQKSSTRHLSTVAPYVTAKPVTLIPRLNPTGRPGLPLTKVHDDKELDKLTQSLMTSVLDNDNDDQGTVFDYLSLIPFMK